MIYPPILQSVQPAFIKDTPMYYVYFTLPSFVSEEDLGHVQIRVFRQSDNKSIVDTSQYPDGVIYKLWSAVQKDGSIYSIPIIASDELSEVWKEGYLYKIQLRFGTARELYQSLADFFTWRKAQIDSKAFSDWSTVMITKAIAKPEVYLKNEGETREDVVSTERTERTLNPLFEGVYSISEESKEPVSKYKFDLYLGTSTDQVDLIETSGWIQNNVALNLPNQYSFKRQLENEGHYTVTYSVETWNGFTTVSSPYHFIATRTYLRKLDGVRIWAEENSEFCQENGCLRIFCDSRDALSGSFVITRSDEKSNYTIWEDITHLVYFNQAVRDLCIFEDYTVESGVRYRYAFQQENRAGLRTEPIMAGESSYYSVDLQYSYLYRDGIQLKIKYDNTLSNYKTNVLRQKQDTIGGKYPFLTSNGKAYYAEFPVNGLITFEMDEGQRFLTLGADGFFYKDELVIPRHKFAENQIRRGTTETDYENPSISRDLTADNIFIERRFREKVEEFLNGFDHKLYRSATEGNKIVGLMNVTLTPKQELGRMIYSFSAIAYELAEPTLDNLDAVGIINIGEFSSLATDDVYLSFGQVQDLYGSNIDIYSLIKEAEAVKTGSGYRMDLRRVTSIWVEQYPQLDFQAEITSLEAQIIQAEEKGEDTTELRAQVEKYKALAQQLKERPTTSTIKLSVNGTEILVAPNKIYHLQEKIESIRLITSQVPFVLNYICETTQVEDRSQGIISSVDSSRIWGQVSGVFTANKDILRYYNHDYLNTGTFQVYHNSAQYRTYDSNDTSDGLRNARVWGRHGNEQYIIYDGMTYDVYKSENLLDIIKERTKRQVEVIYKTSLDTETADGQWTDGQIYYEFNELTLFDIEVDPGTKLLIGKAKDGSDAITTIVGPTGRYTISPADAMIGYISLEKPQFCVINYKCLTNQMRMDIEEEGAT